MQIEIELIGNKREKSKVVLQILKVLECTEHLGFTYKILNEDGSEESATRKYNPSIITFPYSNIKR